MTKLTIELEDDAYRDVVEKARMLNLTLSEWIAFRITVNSGSHVERARDAMGYPLGWFERTEGSLADLGDFCEPLDRAPGSVDPMY